MNRPRSRRQRVTTAATFAAVLFAAVGVAGAQPAHAATTAVWSAGTLTVTGDRRAEEIIVSRDAGGNLIVRVNGRTLAVAGGLPTVGNTTLISVFGNDGKDMIALDQANGALPSAALHGGRGKDTLIGGSGGDSLFGDEDEDVLDGKGGADLLTGGDDRDRLTGGDADDQVFGNAGADTFVWNPGDDTDLNEGGDGTDTVRVNGGGGDESFTATANGTRVRFDRINPAPFAIDIGTVERLHLFANSGNDTFAATGNLAALIGITVDGGPGNDTLQGSNGADTLRGGDGVDFVDGQQGNDAAWLGAGDDVFQWDPGDGSDRIEGESGADRLLFNGSNAAELFELSANGGRVRFTRNVGAITLDLDGVETFDTATLGSTDTLTVGDLAGTDVTDVGARLASTIGGATPDAAADNVIVRGTAGPDAFVVVGSGGTVDVTGLAYDVHVTAPDPTADLLTIQGGDGTDTVDQSGLTPGTILFTFVQ